MREDIDKYTTHVCMFVPSLSCTGHWPFIAGTMNKMSVGFCLPTGNSLLNHFSNVMREGERNRYYITVMGHSSKRLNSVRATLITVLKGLYPISPSFPRFHLGSIWVTDKSLEVP